MVPVTFQPLDRPAPTRVKVADGVYVFMTAPYGNVGLDGNSVVFLADDGVLVFDTNGTPSAAAAVLTEIRKLTDKPVRYVVNSHWHWDHWYGTEVYQQAFPGLQIITNEKNRKMMMGPALEFNRPGLERDLPAYIAGLETRQPSSPDLPQARFFLEQKNSVHHIFPNLTFSDRLDLHMNGRDIQVLHYGRAVTPGDTFLYLPKEKLLVTGDLLVNPISFALSCYPTEWLSTLERLDRLEVSTIIPGHGAPLTDKELLHNTMDVFRMLLAEARDAKSRELDPDAARKEVLPSIAGLKAKILKGHEDLSPAFDIQLVDWYLHRAFEELDGPLTDAISAIPRG
jgi:glyoxylase-like metal-dependent hydrolase (beta-lactamase superfamily II)